jgi:hypothetical protein
VSSILTLNIIDGRVLLAATVMSVAALVGLVVRRVSRSVPTAHRRWGRQRQENHRRYTARKTHGRHHLPAHPLRRWIVALVAGAAVGAIVAVVVLYVCEVTLNVFGLPLDPDTHAWVIASFAAVGVAVVNLGPGRWWRRAGAAGAIALFAATATLGINAGYGLNPTVGSFLGIPVAHPIALPHNAGTTAPTAGGAGEPLWESWKPPAGMPAEGKFGSVTIPATVSKFVARPAWLYLPPAALVAHAPALPVLIMMMGQPGGPESSALFLPTLNALAAAHHGLGPIVLTIDQLGAPTKNPLCINSPAGDVSTYVMTDVVTYVRSSLRVAAGPVNWAVGGYSNGGECALAFGAKHPDVFGSIADISGEIGPSLGTVAKTIRLGFAGNAAAYTAQLPLTILGENHYPDSLAIFTNGSADPVYGPEAAEAAAAAKAAGMTTARFVGQGVGHRADAVLFGLPKALALLYPRWNLQQAGG